ncbi:MAG: hypothetical protein IPM51_06545 [Sphingobacteriaceae bacterium]|nr:hypothetical protein [Sphingobacteriaceae bacterium]
MNKLFEELKDLSDDASHRSALRIQSIINDNPDLFIKEFGIELYTDFLKGINAIAGTSKAHLNSNEFKVEYGKQLSLLKYYLNRVSP